ncbi:MAG: prepilin peptidase [Lachnospiraceae bacterium]|nr:prepilin peptidase [Lachnospiraceae bacterium]
MLPAIMLYIIIFLYGIVIGSFLNVCIFRIPKQENIVKIRSHCMNCGYQLKWYDLVPVFSYLCLGGKCRSCKQKISVQYPLIELLNGVLYCTVFAVYGLSVEALLYALLTSALIALSVIDFRTYEIPVGINIFILTLGLIRIVTDYADWLDYAVGFFIVSGFLYIVHLVTKGRGIGGGDIKLMAAAGLLLGWKLILLAFVLGCIIGSVVHVARMKISGQGHMLAFGPYLSVGILISALVGDQMLAWYLSWLGL